MPGYKDAAKAVYAGDHVLVPYEGTSTEFCVISADSPEDEDQRWQVAIFGKKRGVVGMVDTDEAADVFSLPDAAFEEAWRRSQTE